MKRVIGLVFMCAAASCIETEALTTASTAAPAAHVTPKQVRKASASAKLSNEEKAAAKEAARQASMKLLAPGDEYFGPLKLSYIGIRNTLRDLGLRYDVNHDLAKQTFSSAQLTERSIRDWQKKYPRDVQVPRAIFALQRLYTKVLSQESRDRAHATAMWLANEFRSSPQAKQLGKTLAYEHLAPLPPPTPEPAAKTAPEPPYTSIFGSKFPSEFATPAPEPTPAPTGSLARPANGAVKPAPTSSPAPSTLPVPVPVPATTLVPVPMPTTGPQATPTASPPKPSPTR